MRLIDKDIDRTLKEHDIARTQYRALYFINRFGGSTQTDLLEVMEVQAPTLTLIIDALVRKGWLTRVKDEDDKRINKLRLTIVGEEKFKHIPDPAHKLNEAIRKKLSADESQTFELALKKIIKGLS
jgi:DNA-binding MarR family transcriptional regulator